MKTSARPLPLIAALLFFLSLTFGLFAQEPPAAPAPAEPTAEAEKAAPAADDDNADDAEKPALRRLDVPTPSATAADDADAADKVAPATPEKPQKQPAAASKKAKRASHHGGNGDARVSIFGDASLGAGEYADAVVSIWGSSTAKGNVGDAVVSIAGSSTSEADVGNSVVSIAGDTRVSSGRVGDAAVAVLGSNYVNVHVGDTVVAILGNVELGPKAEVGQVVCVGGTVTRDPAAIVHGQVNQVSFSLPFVGSHFEGLHAWLRHCLLLGRPLAFGAHLLWVWGIALTLLALYLIIALLFPRGVERSVETFEQRPGMSILTAFLVTLLAPLAVILLVITIIGAPALLVALFIAGLFGKAVMLAWIGRRITLRLGAGFASPVWAVLFGGVIVLFLYTIPFVGFLVAKLLSWLGVGAVVYTLIQGSKRNKAAARAAAASAPAAPSVAAPVASAVPVAPFAPVTPVTPATPPTPSSVLPPLVVPASAFDAEVVATPVSPAPEAAVPPPVPPVASESSVPPTAVPPVAPPPLPVVSPAATLPRAGFWIRLGASALDAVLIAIAVNFLPHVVRPNFMLALAIYSAVLWALKGTTVGGIVCGLKVVRLDDRPMDWATAIVRALGGFLSFFVAGLGFLWVVFDDDKQSWHDKIAGTTVVLVPKGTSLI